MFAEMKSKYLICLNETIKNKKMKKAITKKIRQGHYLHLASGLHIVYTMGDVTGYWNIWENEECTSEWMVSIPTKWQAIDKIEKSF